MEDMMKIQAELEQRMASQGIDRFRKAALKARQRGDPLADRSMKQVLELVIDPLSSAILKFRDEAGSGRAGRRHSSVKLTQGVEAETLAYLTARVVLGGMTQHKDLTGHAIQVGGSIEQEKRLIEFGKTEAGKGTLSRTLDYLDTDHFEHRRKALAHMIRVHGDDWTPWVEREKMLVGLKLTELLVQSTGLFTLDRRRERHRTIATLNPTPRFFAWLDTLDMQFEVMSPNLLPCVVPPKDWDGLVGGGYYTTAMVYPLQLVLRASKAHRKRLEKADLSAVYSAINAVQRTAWAVNTRTLEVAQELVNACSTVAGLPSMELETIPAKPVDIDTNTEAKTQWKRAARDVHTRNRASTSKRIATMRTLKLAQEFAAYPAIYFPYQLDFRGRMYATPPTFQPQAGDLAKGLLTFANGERIDSPEALDWFLIHGANSFGVDKLPFGERMKWAMDNQKDILATAAHPLDHLWWTEADSPFVFLSWCFEFAEWVANPDFLSRIPVAMDGSCNGIQHYSAMLRDPVGGKAVNLVPGDEPQDIYAEVADAVNLTFGLAAGDGSDRFEPEFQIMAEKWLAFGIDRSITKRPVMVLPYGGTLNSCMDYVRDAVMKQIDGGKQNPFGDELFKATNWLASRIWEAIGQVVVGARLGMGWLQDVAAKVSAEGKPLHWTTPSGFVIRQAYVETRETQIETVLMGSRYAPLLHLPIPETIDKRRQRSSLPPNFVHGMDAAALTLTVNKATACGVTSFAMVHDSYGTTAAKAGVLARATREEFVRMYEHHDVLVEFEQDTASDLTVEVNSPPRVGGLSLPGVLESKYFFA